MALRKGYLLCWMNGKKLVTLKAGPDEALLPVFTTEESCRAAADRIPIPPDGVLLRIEIVADEEDRFKYAAAGGSYRDLTLDWSRLTPMWDTEAGFEERFRAYTDAPELPRSC